MSGLDGVAPLAEVEKRRLSDCEAIIARGLDAVRGAGSALAAIRDDRLYRTTHATFEDYCRDRWGMTRRHIDRMIDHASVVAAVTDAASVSAESSNVGMRPIGLKHPEEDGRSNVGIRPMGPIPELDDFHAPWEPEINEYTARQIRPVLPEVTEEIRSRVAAGADPVTTTYEVIEAKRAEVTKAKKAKAAPPADAEELARLREQVTQEIEHRIEIATLAEELQTQLEAYEQAQEGECEQALIAARKEIATLRGQIRSLEVVRDDYMRQCGQLRKEVKMLRRRLGD